MMTTQIRWLVRMPLAAMGLALGMTAAAYGQCHVQTVSDAVGFRTHMSDEFVASSPNYYMRRRHSTSRCTGGSGLSW